MNDITPVIDSPTILIYDDCLEFNPFQCDTLEEVKLRYDAMLGGINRCALYYAYSVGRLVMNENALKQKFGVDSVAQVAKKLDVSAMSLTRYRRVAESLTENQVRSLAGRAISINAILKIAEIKEDYPQEADKLLDALMSGELRTAKDLDMAKVQIIEELMSVRNLLNAPANPTPALLENTSDDSVIDAEVIEEDDGKSPAERLADTVEEGDDSEGDEIETTVLSPVDDDSQNKRDIRNLMRSCRTEMAPARRDLLAVQDDIPAQLEVILGREDVIIGDPQAYEEYTELITEFFELCQSATEKLAMIVEKGIDRGILKRPCVLPESTSIDKLFRTEE